MLETNKPGVQIMDWSGEGPGRVSNICFLHKRKKKHSMHLKNNVRRNLKNYVPKGDQTGFGQNNPKFFFNKEKYK